MQDLRKRFAVTGSAPRAAQTPSTVRGWEAYAEGQTDYAVRVIGLNNRGLRFAVAEVRANGLVLVHPDGTEGIVGFGEAVVEPTRSISQPLSGNPYRKADAKK